MQDFLFYTTQSLTAETPWLLPLCFALFGACIGSFLNVVIYRLPRGLSVNEPRRSFCPGCKAPIPWHLNLPIVSWLLLRGRSACCHQPISPRYWIVEVATTLLFALLSWNFSADDFLVQALICVWAAAMLATFCIDWEQMIVLPTVTGVATAAGLLTALLAPWLVAEGALDNLEGLLGGLVGAVGGFVLFRLVALAGRLLFGARQEDFPEDCEWSMKQAGDDIELRLGDRRMLWSELFLENANRLTLRRATMEGRVDEPGDLRFSVDSVKLPNGESLALEDCDSLRGRCRGVVHRREAMGSGDAWIALAIGSLCGWQGVVFSLVAGSVIGILWALAARIGRGKPMPFGPSLIAGAFIWLFWGHRIEYAYLDWCANMGLY